MSSLTPKRISGRDLEILYRHLSGMKNYEIAQDVGISEQTVSNTLRSDWARNEIALLHARTLDKIANGQYSPLHLARAVATEALSIQVALMRSSGVKSHVRARIADSILDRAGFRPATRIENLDLNDIFDKMSPEELESYANSGELPDRFSGTNVSRFLAAPGPDEPDLDPDTITISPESTTELDVD